MGNLVKMERRKKGDIALLAKTDKEIIIRLFNYKHKGQIYNFKKCIAITTKSDGIHFPVFSDDIVISLSVFESLTKAKIIRKHEYFK